MEQLEYHIDSDTSTPPEPLRFYKNSSSATPEFPLQCQFQSDMVAETEIRIQAAVPFLWEEKPGTPKKNWRPPGNPIPSPEPEFSDPLRSPSSCSDDLFDLDPRAFRRNAAAPGTEISEGGAPSAEESIEGSDAADSETDSGSAAANLTGSSILECLFPLFANGGGYDAKEDSSVAPEEEEEEEVESKDRRCRFAGRRTAPTLGELIQMSRRRSFHLKAVHTRNQEVPPSLEFPKRGGGGAFGCCIFGTSGGSRIEAKARLRLN